MSIKVKDDSSTPIEWTFVKRSDDGKVSVYVADDDSVPVAARPRLTFTEETLKSGDVKVTQKLEIPVMEVVEGNNAAGYEAPPKVAFVLPFIFTAFVNQRALPSHMASGLRVSVGLLQGATGTTGTGTLQNTAAGGAFLASAASVVNFFTRQMRP